MSKRRWPKLFWFEDEPRATPTEIDRAILTGLLAKHDKEARWAPYGGQWISFDPLVHSTPARRPADHLRR